MNRRTAKRGITLTELLVVLAILGLLVALLLPALNRGKRAALAMREVAALRQVLVGWTSYATDNSGRLMPGFMSGLPVFQADGNGIPPGIAGSVSELESRFPWRLIRHLNHDFRALYVNESAEALQELQQSDPQQFYYMSSLYPSFGLNSVWVGGDQQRYGFLPGTLPNGNVNPLSRFYATRLSSIQHTDRVTVFASSRTSATVDGALREGFFRIEGPKFVSGQASVWAAEYDPLSPQSFGNLSARASGSVAVGTADGGVAWVPIEEMRDMRRWSDLATSADWAIPVP